MSGDPPLRVAAAALVPGTPRRSTAWDLLRSMLPPDVILSNACERCGGAHGRVRIDDDTALHASVTYAGGVAIAAVAAHEDAVAIGVDAEPSDTVPALDRVLRPGAGIRDWVRYEAVAKADGRGVRLDPREVRFDASADGTVATTADAAYRVIDVDIDDDLVVSVALRTAVPADRSTR